VVEDKKPLFIGWRKDQHNGLPSNGYVLVPSASSEHIVVSLKDNGCGWIESDGDNIKAEFKIRFNASKVNEGTKDEVKETKLTFTLYELGNEEPIGFAIINISLQCNKATNKSIKGTIELANSDDTESNGADDLLAPTLVASCEGTVTTISVSSAPLQFIQPALDLPTKPLSKKRKLSSSLEGELSNDRLSQQPMWDQQFSSRELFCQNPISGFEDTSSLDDGSTFENGSNWVSQPLPPPTNFGSFVMSKESFPDLFDFRNSSYDLGVTQM